MKNLREYLEEQINENLIQAVLSAGRNKDGISKIKIRPIRLKGQICYQASATEGQKVLHKNYGRTELIEYVEKELAENFRQFQAQGAVTDGVVLVSKKGKMTIKQKHHEQKEKVQIQAHNRVKQYILKEGVPVPFLIDLGVMNEQGKIIHARYDKFRQINRFLEFIEDILPRLSRDREITILDFGCGKSYLTFAMYYYLRELKGYDVNIIGLDLKTDVIEKCNSLALRYGYEKLHFYHGDIADYEGITILDFGCGKSYLTFAMYYYLRELKGYDVNIIGLDLKTDVIEKCNSLALRYGYEKLHFYHGDIADYEGVSCVDMVVTLHACDTATDYALAKAVEWGAEVILSVPCCQHEVNKQIKNEMLEPVLRYGILKERMSALITDAVRADLLESKGYDTQILEFIDMEHTPKNLLIRAVRTGKRSDQGKVEKMLAALNIHPTLDRLLNEKEQEGSVR